jgi:hypothetical protein
MAGDKQDRTVDLAARAAARMAKRIQMVIDRWGVTTNG